MRCKICLLTFRIPPPTMREDQICAQCRSKIKLDYNEIVNEKIATEKKADQLAQKIKKLRMELKQTTSTKEEKIEKLNIEENEKISSKNIHEDDPSLTFNKYRGKLLESIKSDELQYLFIEMEKRINRMSIKQITKLFNEI
ncbi:MAG: hypothetical protein WD154_05490 [Nitrosopumilaceae archaeon]